ncbi:hypothetical protein LY76DRAFT_591388, partial [Colletotrichum caudatum]
MGDMGKMYAQRLSAAGWKIMACDQEEKYESLKEEFSGNVRDHATQSLPCLPRCANPAEQFSLE